MIKGKQQKGGKVLEKSNVFFPGCVAVISNWQSRLVSRDNESIHEEWALSPYFSLTHSLTLQFEVRPFYKDGEFMVQKAIKGDLIE